MAKYTVLEIVNKCLEVLGSDEVNAIDQTIESGRVASFIEQVYFETIDQGTWPHLHKIVNLEATTSAYPNYLRIPDQIADIDWIKYDVRDTLSSPANFVDVTYLDPYEFTTLVLSRDSSLANVVVIQDYDGADQFIRNDIHPTYWTSYDDEHVVFDAWKSTLDSELVSDKSRASVYREPTWSPAPDAIPDLPSRAFSGFLAECISTVQFNLRQKVNEKAEQQSRRQRHQRSRRGRGRTVNSTRIPDYGRRTAGNQSRGKLVVGRNTY